MTGSLCRRIINYCITRGRLHAGSYHESFYSTVHGIEWQIKKNENKTKKPLQIPMISLQSIFQLFSESYFLEVKLATRMTCLGVHLISAAPLSLSISTNSKSVPPAKYTLGHLPKHLLLYFQPNGRILWFARGRECWVCNTGLQQEFWDNQPREEEMESERQNRSSQGRGHRSRGQAAICDCHHQSASYEATLWFYVKKP